MLMPGNGLYRVMPAQCFRQGYQRFILFRHERIVIRSLDFDTDGKIVASCPTAKVGNTGMPRPFVGRDELKQCSVASYQEMG